MSRSGYSDAGDIDQWGFICWRGAVNSAIKGKRGQAFLKEMLAALDSMDTKALIANDLVRDAGTEHKQVCAIGAVAVKRGLDVSGVNPEDRDTVAGVFGIAPALAAEIVYVNDEWCSWRDAVQETPEKRFERVRAWIVAQIKPEVPPVPPTSPQV